MNTENIALDIVTARFERMNKRLWILCIILVLSLICTNAGWLYYENQMEEVTVSQEIDATADGYGAVNLKAIGGDYYSGKSACEADG